MKEILTIQVRIKEIFEVKGHKAETAMLLFDGDCDCENFKGKILPGGVDTQKEACLQKRILSARYILEGMDSAGKSCRIFIENNGIAGENGRIEATTPQIITDSRCLGWMEQEELTGTITPAKDGVTIHIFSKER